MEFQGFSPKQQFALLKKMGYTGSFHSDEMDKFIAATPSAASKLGRIAEAVSSKTSKMGMSEGGLVDFFNSDWFADATSTPRKPKDPNAIELLNKGIDDPSSLVTQSAVQNIEENDNQLIDEGTGSQKAPDVVSTATVSTPEVAVAAPDLPAATVDTALVGDKAEEALTDLEAATGGPSEKATVQGQLDSLMEDFESGTPPWAAGAMRSAMSSMQARGLGASSMAGAAIVQAAMESAVAVASSDAQINAQFELQNLTNTQQTGIFKTQQTLASLFSDQAAENASAQFNAASENQTNQFFSDLKTTVSRFNSEQINAIAKFNAGEENAISKFNSELKAQREQFNATNSLVIAQANAKWRQDIAKADTAAQNQSNLQTAQSANGITSQTLDQIWQKERDIMNFAFVSSESAEERNLKLLLGDKQIAGQSKAATQQGLGYLAGRLLFG